MGWVGWEQKKEGLVDKVDGGWEQKEEGLVDKVDGRWNGTENNE